jgi:hypothetical protein
MRRGSLVAAVAAVVVNGCSDPKLQARVATLEQQNIELASTIDKQQSQIRDLALDVMILKSGDVAYLNSTSEGYSVARSSLGTFAVSLEKVEPYLAGFKLTFAIGNVTTATFDAAKLKVRWNSAARQVAQAVAAPTEPKNNEKETTLSQQLRPGAYTRAQVILSPATVEDIKELWVEVETNRMSLRGW